MWDVNPCDLPMSTTTRFVPQPDTYEALREDKDWYASAVGSIMYLMMGTRPDIAFAISVLSRFLGNPGPSHLAGVKTLMRYLRGTLDFDLVYRGELRHLGGYTDSDWAGDTDTRRSTAGYVFNIGSAAISWSSKRQPTVALSSTEAEYMAQTQATKEAIWLRRFLNEINKPDSSSDPVTTIIYGDNQGAIALAKNPQFHARSKHIGIQHNFVREKVTSGEIDICYVPTHEQVADGLTKALSKASFTKFRTAVGLESRT
jgi:hypothetical protein